MPTTETQLPENPTLEQELEAQVAENPELAEDADKGDFDSDALLLGKFKSQEELAKAYQELERKLGSSGQQEPSPTEEVAQETEAPTAVDDLSKFYGEGLTKFAQDNDLDLAAINQEFSEKGELSDQSYEALAKAGFGKEFMDTYLAGIKYQQQQGQQEVLSKAYESLGGQEELQTTIQWAAENLSDSEKDAYNELVDSGKVDAALSLLKGYNAQMKMKQGFEGKLVTGQTSGNMNDVFESQAQVLEAMSDPRYEKDPAYRRKVIQKIERSKNI